LFSLFAHEAGFEVIDGHLYGARQHGEANNRPKDGFCFGAAWQKFTHYVMPLCFGCYPSPEVLM
jgi:hypothetical protein